MSLIEKFTEIGKYKIDLSKLEAYEKSFQETKIIVNGVWYQLPINTEKFEEILREKEKYEEEREIYLEALFEHKYFRDDIEHFIKEVQQYEDHPNYEKMKLLLHGIILQYFKCHHTQGDIFQENLEVFINNFRNAKFDFYQVLIPNQ